MASSNRKNIKRLLSWSSGSSSTASENEDESKLGKENVSGDDVSNTNNIETKSENNEATKISKKTSKSPKIIDFPPLPRVTSPQKLSRKNFDKHKISAALLKEHCRQNDLYMTPHLNTVLYLHHKGFNIIESLEAYTGLKTLWLENNNFRVIQNLSHLSELKNLYLHNNKIEKIENLTCLKNLSTLNLSSNAIGYLNPGSISCLPNLHTLLLSRNKLRTAEDIEELSNCSPELSILDLSYNCLDEAECIDRVLVSMPCLRVLTFMGNPVVRKTKDYRRSMILKLKALTYLDTRPVRDKDRLCAEAWLEGGLKAERNLREKWAEEEQARTRESVMALVRKRDENLKRRGIDPTDNESQIKAIEDRGKEILAEYKAQKEKCRISPREAEEILEPVHNAFKDLKTGLDMKYGTSSDCSHKGCTFDHSKLKTNHDENKEDKENSVDHRCAQEIPENEEIKSDSEDFVSLNDKDDHQRRADSGMDKSINDSLATSSTSGFVEIESSQKENSKEENIDISFNSTNNADDEEEEDDKVPSLAMDSDDDEEEWDKCSSSTKGVSNDSNRLSESNEICDGNDFEMVKSQDDNDVKSVPVTQETSGKDSCIETTEGSKDQAETIMEVSPATIENTERDAHSTKGCEGKPDVDCDYWNCSYCNYWNDGNRNVQNEPKKSKINEKITENSDSLNDLKEQQRYEEVKFLAKNSSKPEDIRNVYLKEMQEFLGEEVGDLTCNDSSVQSTTANQDDKTPSKLKTDEQCGIQTEKEMNNESLVKYAEPENISNSRKSCNKPKEIKSKRKIESDEACESGLAKFEETVHQQNETQQPRYERSFDGSTVKYETFAYSNEDVIKLDAKLHQFIEHLKTADPKVESSMAALGEAKEDVRKSHGQESSTRKELNDDFLGHLKNRLDDSMKYDKDANLNDLNIDYSELDDQDESKLSLVEKLSMLEDIQNSILEENDTLEGDEANEDKVEQWLKSHSSLKAKEKKPFMAMTPRPQGQTPWERVETDTIDDLSETFSSVDVDEKKRVKGSSGMTWENEMVKLVQKLSKEVKSSPNYNERKKQMLKEHREYLKQEKLKRKSGRPLSTGSILNSSPSKIRRPKTAQNRVSFADSGTEYASNLVKPEIDIVENTEVLKVAKTSTKSSCCMGTNTNDLSSSLSEVSNSPIKRMDKEKEDDARFISTKSSGTSTDDLLSQNDQSSFNKQVGFSVDTDISSDNLETNMIESIKSIVDNLVEEKVGDEDSGPLEKKVPSRTALKLKASIETNLEQKRRERQKLYIESSDSDSDSGNSDSTSDPPSGYDINDKVYDKLFEKANICEIDDDTMLKMKEKESDKDDNISDTEQDEKLINMLKVLPKRESARTSMNSFDVTSFVDLSTPKGGCRKKSGHTKLFQRDKEAFSETIATASDFLEGEMAMNDLKCQKLLRNSEDFYRNHFAELPENEKHETSKREKSERASVNTKKSICDEEKKRKKFVPFQYYATTGEADDEPSQLESESTNSTWDQKMEEELDRTTLMFQNFIQNHDLARAKSEANFNEMIQGGSTTNAFSNEEEDENKIGNELE